MKTKKIHKWLLCTVCVLWIVLLLKQVSTASSWDSLPVNMQNMDGLIPSASGSSFRQTGAILELSSVYPDYLPVSSQQNLLHELALHFGLTQPPSPITSHRDNGTVTLLEQESVNGTLRLEYLSVQESWKTTDYLRLRLALPDASSLNDFYPIFQEIQKYYGLDGVICSLVQGIYPDILTASQRENIAHQLLGILDSSFVQAVQSGDTDTFYGYTPSVTDFIQSDGSRINITIAFSQGENGTTLCSIGSPIITVDY